VYFILECYAGVPDCTTRSSRSQCSVVLLATPPPRLYLIIYSHPSRRARIILGLSGKISPNPHKGVACEEGHKPLLKNNSPSPVIPRQERGSGGEVEKNTTLIENALFSQPIDLFLRHSEYLCANMVGMLTEKDRTLYISLGGG